MQRSPPFSSGHKLPISIWTWMCSKKKLTYQMPVCLKNILHLSFLSSSNLLTTHMSVRRVKFLGGGFVVFAVKQLRITIGHIQAFVLICCIIWWHYVVYVVYVVVALWACGLDASRLHSDFRTSNNKKAFLILNLFLSCYLVASWKHDLWEMEEVVTQFANDMNIHMHAQGTWDGGWIM